MAVTFGNIAGEESATVTFKMATVTIDRNSTVAHQEIMTIGSPQTSNALAAVVASAPASTEFGLVVRVADNVTIQGNSTVFQGGTWNVTNVSGTVSLPTGAATAAKQPALGTAGTPSADVISVQGAASMTPISIQGNSSVVQSGTWNIGTVTAVTAVSSLGGVVTIQGNSSAVQSGTWNVRAQDGAGNALESSTSAPSTGARGLITREVIAGVQTFASTNLSSATTTILSSAAASFGRVFAYSITTTQAGPCELKFCKGSTLLWPIRLAAISSAVSGANLAVSPPGYLFASVAAKDINLVTNSTGSYAIGISYFVST